jgi:exopolysaccharide production protein ExoF
LRQKRDATTRELQAAQDQLDKVQSLAKNGLAINDRVNAAMTAAEDLESRGLDIDNAVLQAQQGLSQAKKENVQIVGKHSADLTTQRQQVDQQIAELELKIATQKQLITEAIAYGGDPRAQEGLDAAYSYTIIRGRQQVPATTTSEVQPGDVIVAKVQLPN